MSDPMRDFERLSDAIEAIAAHVERYERFASDLRIVRLEQVALAQATGMRIDLDDMEAELTYLRVRALAPAKVVQLGCGDGWSTSWLLRALRDNGRGRLVTLDLTGRATPRLPEKLTDGRWRLVAGDVRTELDRLPGGPDYLFVDSAGSGAFAKWCLDDLAASLGPATPVSVGGVFGGRSPLGGAARVRRWLRRGRVDWFTAAPVRQPVVHRQLDRVRCALGLNDPIGRGRREATVFFRTALP